MQGDFGVALGAERANARGFEFRSELAVIVDFTVADYENRLSTIADRLCFRSFEK